MEITGETLDVILDALAEQLRSLGEQMEVVVIGGSALTALGLVKRTTRDVDLLAIAENGELRPAEPLPEALRTARDRIARDFELSSPGYRMVLVEALSVLGVEDADLGA
jgi:hypothetical protein